MDPQEILRLPMHNISGMGLAQAARPGSEATETVQRLAPGGTVGVRRGGRVSEKGGSLKVWKNTRVAKGRRR